MSRHFGPAEIGRVRYVCEKFDKDPKALWDQGLEIHHADSFNDDFISLVEHGPHDLAADVVSEHDHEMISNLRDILKDSPNGFYEVVGYLWYEFDPGFDSPNGPAEADAHAWIEKPKFVKLTDAQAEHYIPKPPPPPQVWEHTTSALSGTRYNTMCKGCGMFVHRCGNCSYMDWEEHNFCSENCWKNAGAPKDPNLEEVAS